MSEPLLWVHVDGFVRNGCVLLVAVVAAMLMRGTLASWRPFGRGLAFGTAFGGIAIATMIFPIRAEFGVLLDLRMVPLMLASPLYGLTAGLAATALAIVARLLIGGPAMGHGLFMIVGAAALGAIVSWRCGWRLSAKSLPHRPITLFDIATLALGAVLVHLVIRAIWSSTSSEAAAQFALLTPLSIIACAVATLVIGTILMVDQRRAFLSASLDQTRERLSTISASIPGIFYRRKVRPDGALELVYVSDSAREILGVPADALVKTPSLFISMLHPDDRGRIVEIVQEADGTNGSSFISEYRIVRPDGVVRWMEAHSRINHAASKFTGEVVADGIALDVTARKEAEFSARRANERLNWVADHDQLTGLPNRSFFQRLVVERLDRHERVALAFVKLRDSRLANELFGQVVGDARIREAARRIGAAVPESVLVARTGSDEFSVVSADQDLVRDFPAICATVLDSLAIPFQSFGQTIPLAADLGYAIAPDHADEAARLMQVALIALETARDRAMGRPLAYSADIEQTRAEARRFDNDLADAVEGGRFTLVFQPVVASGDRRLMGREALLRWTRPGYGPVRPDVFVERAEAIGLWQRLDAWVLRQACHEAATWPADLWISVNVSAAWLKGGDLDHVVRDVLAETGLAPDRLQIEVTERVLIEDYDRALAGFAKLHEIGVSVSIDDFGAGYSSLGYLHRLPIRKIKLDKSFIDNIATDERARAIVRSVLTLCGDLGINAVAEGVETEEQLGWLVALGCPAVQGYLTGRPGPVPPQELAS